MKEFARTVTAAALGAVVGAVAMWIPNHWDRQAEQRLQRPGWAEIAMPGADFDSVSRNITVSGRMELPEDVEKQLWVVVGVHVNNANTYYPQGAVVRVGGGPSWTCSISLGSIAPEEDGLYTVIAAFVAPPHTATLAEYVSNELSMDQDGMKDFSADWIDVKAKRVVERRFDATDSAQQESHKYCG